ncbi:MAG TPA: hypothetical protein VNI56_04015 [Xanthomonadaceae bacterium]|nr:hypothetical protein [Xanthomonadaceae bacterium]
MQTKTAASSTLQTAARPAETARIRVPNRPNGDDRAFGVGYGSSSGYASAKRYTQGWTQARFRCA